MTKFHTLSKINEESRTAICAICGCVKIYKKGIRVGKKHTRIWWRCGTSHYFGLNNRIRKCRLLTDFIKNHNKCFFCKESTTCCLDFHHLNQDKKESTIAYLAGRGKKPQVLQEIQKCAVLCSNCHRKLHNNLLSSPEPCKIDFATIELFWENA